MGFVTEGHHLSKNLRIVNEGFVHISRTFLAFQYNVTHLSISHTSSRPKISSGSINLGLDSLSLIAT
jgi:hypothetical protein